MKKGRFIVFLFSVALLFFCCRPSEAQSWSRIPVTGRTELSRSALKEAELLEKCRPALDSLYTVVGFSPEGIMGYRPFSPLGNFVSDMLLERTRRLCDAECQLAVVNYGGVRVDMPRGDIRLDDIRSMFPFRDSICIVRTRGANILSAFNKMASDKWEFFSGAQVVADSSHVISIKVAGEPLDTNRIYTLACGDFLLDGGDGFHFSRGARSVTKTRYGMFSLMLSCLEEMKGRNEPVSATVDDRLVLLNARKEGMGVRVAEHAADDAVKPRLTILHTNDTHSHLEPGRGGRYDGRGGVVARAAVVDSIRRVCGRRNVLLLDAGDFFQGTSYFPLFGGRVEVEAMNIMGYDVTTLGNHEWDYGAEALEENLRRAHFRTVLCNYRVKNPQLARKLRPFVIVRRGGMKIGILGALTDISSKVKGAGGLDIVFDYPVEPVNRWAAFLKKERHCDIVILLSHCGYDDGSAGNPSDSDMAPLLSNVDIIIGGHTHTDMKEPVWFKDASGRDIMVVTDFKWGLSLGEIKIGG